MSANALDMGERLTRFVLIYLQTNTMIQRLKEFNLLRWWAKSPLAEKIAVRPIMYTKLSKQVSRVLRRGSGKPLSTMNPHLNHR
jgi:hypothetical protein